MCSVFKSVTMKLQSKKITKSAQSKFEKGPTASFAQPRLRGHSNLMWKKMTFQSFFDLSEKLSYKKLLLQNRRTNTESHLSQQKVREKAYSVTRPGHATLSYSWQLSSGSRWTHLRLKHSAGPNHKGISTALCVLTVNIKEEHICPSVM